MKENSKVIPQDMMNEVANILVEIVTCKDCKSGKKIKKGITGEVSVNTGDFEPCDKHREYLENLLGSRKQLILYSKRR